jgi:tyrosine-protein phosphatase YwqE
VQLFKNNLVHILASDCHFSAGTRSPKLSPGFDAAVKLVGFDRAAKMVIDLPKAILNDQTVSPPIPESNVKWNKNWWEFWL